MKKAKNILIFSNFDGTISLENVSIKMFGNFTDAKTLVARLMDGELDIYHFWRELCATLPKGLEINEIKQWAGQEEIDPFFEAFAIWCKNKEIKLKILSDGFDICIDEILQKNNLEHLKRFCNRLTNNNNGFKPVFGYASESCDCKSAVCKRNVLINNSEENSILVFIGDDILDFCVAKHSDIVFAKGLLARYCNENKIPHYPYKSFFDVGRILADKIGENKLKQRNVAMINRKHAIASE